MNQTHSKKLLRGARIFPALLAAFFLIPKIRAQPAEQMTGDRWLFIFETSTDMKPRVPATQTEINDLLETSMGGQLHAGDSIGVWTFDRDLHMGQFPLLRWAPEDAKTVATGLNKFVRDQRYTKGATFEALPPLLNQIVRNSPRLTVLIFCDGENKISGTPYDNGLNQVFQQRQAGQKQARQPFVLVLRTQLGHYIGCTLNFPPGMVNFPEFPPFPPPPAPPAPTNAPPPAPPPQVVTPLIIIGTNVETSWPPKPKPLPTNVPPATQTNAVPVQPINTLSPPPPHTVAVTNAVTNLPPPKQEPAPPINPAPVTQTNIAPAPPAKMATLTNPILPANAIAPASSVAPTNSSATPENSGIEHKSALALGAGLLIAAAALVALACFRSRRSNRGSLISRSMRKP